MTKRVTIRGQKDIYRYQQEILTSAEETQIKVCELAGSEESMELFYRMKFEEIGCDPLDSSRRLNLIEQINQTFTYAASLKAAEYLLKHHIGLRSLTLNLGTRSGWDIETSEDGGLVAEVFASVHPRNNRKLEKNIQKVAAAEAKHRYVFFMCPGLEPGPYREKPWPLGVEVVSLGCDLP
ncbi:MAG: hypothetical protein JRJ50_14560 [Deltaproteobacteria bacterium]|nr:hypothetical protein [Deltaproteobacteria bacterium]MBW2142588.1 hypothetical protein [Deltaproteobacteria bacterium]MBW2331324.1 hypothetical protein [Deltaproteobacteria bacterium]